MLHALGTLLLVSLSPSDSPACSAMLPPAVTCCTLAPCAGDLGHPATNRRGAQDATHAVASRAQEQKAEVLPVGGGASAVPEPSTWLLLGTGLLGLVLSRRLRKVTHSPSA